MTCDECGRETREVFPVARTGRSIAWYHRHEADRVLPRTAIYALNPALEASIPFGALPDDDRYFNACRTCADKLAA